jgi:hypothetical protein
MMALKVVLTVPSAVTAMMITTEPSAAMSQYSMAVALTSCCEVRQFAKSGSGRTVNIGDILFTPPR